jgi:hypothetical protein
MDFNACDAPSEAKTDRCGRRSVFTTALGHLAIDKRFFIGSAAMSAESCGSCGYATRFAEKAPLLRHFPCFCSSIYGKATLFQLGQNPFRGYAA